MHSLRRVGFLTVALLTFAFTFAASAAAPAAANQNAACSSTVLADGTVSVSWADLDGFDIDVQRDGQSVATTTASSYDDTGLTPGTYSYAITATRTVAGGVEQIQAEHYRNAFDVHFENHRAGFTGSGYLNYGGPSSWALWDVDSSGLVTVDVRYSNGSFVNRVSDVWVDGNVVGSLQFPPTGGWDQWQTDSITLDLGNPDWIAVQGILNDNGNAGPHIDRIDIAEQAQVETVTLDCGTATIDPPPPALSCGAVANADGTVSISWDAHPNEDKHVVRRDGSFIATVTNGATSFVDNPGVGTFDYVIRSFNANGRIEVDCGTVVVDGPPPPALTCNAIVNADGTVDLGWDSHPDEDKYVVRRDGVFIGSVNNFTTTYTDEPGEGTYGYAIRSFNANGRIEVDCGTVTVTPPPPPAELVCAVALDANGNPVITWNDIPDEDVYIVRRDGVFRANVGNNTTYTDTTAPAGDRTYEVRSTIAGVVNDVLCGTVTVVGPPPAELVCNVAIDANGDPVITWNDLPDEDLYRVRRDGVFLANVANDGTSYTDTTASAGDRFYEVRTIIAGVTTDTPCGTVTVVRPELTCNAVANADGTVTVTWDAHPNEDIYRLRRDGLFLVQLTDQLTYTDSPGVGTFEYLIRSEIAPIVTNVPCGTVTVNPVTLVCTVALDANGNPVVTWNDIPDEDVYIVRRDGVFLANVGNNTTYTDTTAAPGNRIYEVRSTMAGATTDYLCGSVDVV